jgi:DNA (cytosine-5)-methyltransferase 1
VKAVDLFAGWGGFTEGATQAGIDVVWAANHWRIAVDVHAMNHLGTRHECQDLRQADWSSLPAYDLLLASPACQGHSTASQPKRRGYHDAMRATAWAVIDCAEVTSPRVILVENVLSFRRWALYPLWRQALETLGYRVQELEVAASSLGVPQRRTRLFISATRSRADLQLPIGAEPAFAPCIEWAAPGWRPVAAASPGARARIERGRRCGRRFLSQHVTGHPGVPLSEPIRTITTKDQWIVVDGDRYRPLTLRELARGMGFPDRYSWPAELARTDVVKGLGNAVPPPVARELVTRIAQAA